MSDFEIIIITRTPWDEPPRARHQVAYALAKNARVLFIEANGFGLPSYNIIKINENLSVLKSKWFFHYKIRYRIPILNELFQLWLLFKLKKLNLKNFVLINFDHTSHLFSKKYKGIYYCNDDHIRNIKIPFGRKYFNNVEKTVGKYSDVCITTSKYLTDKLLNINSNTFEIKLGAPNINFNNSFVKSRKKDIINIVIVGFFDLDHIPIETLFVISKISKFRLSLVGKVSQNFLNKVKGNEKIELNGVLIGDALYRKIAESDVCLALYSHKDKNRGRTPNKLWLYLALGKPVVVTNIKNIDNWIFNDDIVYKADNNDMIQTIFKAFNRDSELLFFKRKEIARNNTWEDRIKELNKYIEKYATTNPTA